jgi:hypothetical protein
LRQASSSRSDGQNGAGGIGGLAVYLDDWNDGGGGSGAIGAMFPAYDGNGNVLRLAATGAAAANGAVGDPGTRHAA